jgi:4,5:9,10-diseco-3-hydroxy-5,9,17-trioxoandrosta-1(10),2-diene-4-oate hydrolase
MDFEKKFVQVDGARIAYVDIGEGKPTILLQGGGPGASGISNYRRNVDELSKSRRLIVPDLPGYGDSEDKLGFHEIYKALGEFLIHFLDALGLDKVDCVGNSLGGMTTVGALLHSSHRINKAVLMGPGGFQPVFTPMPTEGMRRMGVVNASDNPTREQMRGVIELLVNDSSFITDELLDERVKAASNPNRFKPFARSFGEMWREDLGSVKNEILVMWGLEDRVCPVDMAPGIIKAFPNASLHLLPNCGHWVQWEKPDDFNKLVAWFFDRN